MFTMFKILLPSLLLLIFPFVIIFSNFLFPLDCYLFSLILLFQIAEYLFYFNSKNFKYSDKYLHYFSVIAGKDTGQ